VNRYFATSEAVYERIRAELNAAFGFPDGNGTDSVFVAAEYAYQADGKYLLWGRADWCDMPMVAPIVGQALAGGDVVEISEQHYWAAAPPGFQ